MNVLRGWQAFRADPDGNSKFMIACLLVLLGGCIPLLPGLVLIGWMSLMLRRAVSGQDTPLPRLDFDLDYMKGLVEPGFKGFLTQLLWSIPMIGMMFALMCCMYAGMMGIGVAAAGAAEAGGSEAGALSGIAMLCMMCVLVFVVPVLSIAMAIPMNIGIMRAELTDDIGAGLKFKEVMDATKLIWRDVLGGMVKLTLLNFVCVFVGIISLYILLIPATVVMYISAAYFRAEIYRVYLEKGGAPLTIGPLAVAGDNLPPPPPAPPGQHHF